MKTQCNHSDSFRYFNYSGKQHHIWFHTFVAYIVCFGYIFCGRGFAGLHISEVPIYIGEVLLMMSGVYFFNDMVSRGINRFQMFQMFILVGFGCLFLKDILFYNGSELISVVRDFATVYYIIFLFLFAGKRGYLFLTKIVLILSRYHLLIGLSLLIHTLFEPILTSVPIVGDDFYGLFFMPGCFVPPLAILLITILIEKSSNIKISKLELFTIGISMSTIILSQSRGAILGAFVALGFYILFLANKRTNRLIMGGLCIIAIPALVLLPFLHDFQERLFMNSKYSAYHLYSNDMLYAKFKSLVDPEGEEYKGATGEGRINWWRAVIKNNNASIATFVFGQGFGYNLGLPINYLNEKTRGAHNAWINIFGWSGLIGVILYGLALFSAFQLILSGLKDLKNENDSNQRLACNTALAFFIAVFVTSMFDNSLSSPVMSIVLYIYLGSTISLMRKYSATGKVKTLIMSEY